MQEELVERGKEALPECGKFLGLFAHRDLCEIVNEEMRAEAPSGSLPILHCPTILYTAQLKLMIRERRLYPLPALAGR
jgi:hypothetical protein